MLIGFAAGQRLRGFGLAQPVAGGFEIALGGGELVAGRAERLIDAMLAGGGILGAFDGWRGWTSLVA